MQTAYSQKQTSFRYHRHTPPYPRATLWLATPLLLAASSFTTSFALSTSRPAHLPAFLDPLSLIPGFDDSLPIFLIHHLLLILIGVVCAYVLLIKAPRPLTSDDSAPGITSRSAETQHSEAQDFNTDSLFLLHFPHNRGSPPYLMPLLAP